MKLLGVVALESQGEPEANSLARSLKLPLLESATQPKRLTEPGVLLCVGPQGLYLQQTGKGAPGPVAVEFGNPAMRHRRSAGQNELLGRAVGVGKKSPLHVLDATAGLGRDSFVLADLCCEVRLCERHRVVAELLKSGLCRGAVSEDSWTREVTGRMTLLGCDARELSAGDLAATDVIYLDPMFPVRRKSASVKKEMALFQAVMEVAGGEADADGDELLMWALAMPVARVVVKRPAKAPPLAGRKPSHVISGKAVRYDVHVLGPLQDQA